MKNSQCFTSILLIFQLCSFTFLLAQENEKHRLKESPCSVYTFTADDLRSGPYRDLFDVLNTLPGVNAFGDLADRPSIRGSDWREVSVIMDGMEMTDQITNWPNLRIPLNIIDTLQVYTGGFIAEYGNARGGLIVITTKTGGDKLSVNADVRYSPAGLKHFGPMAYGVDSPIVRPFVDESAGAFTGNAYFEGWNALAFETLKPRDPHYGKPYENYALYLWQHRSRDNLDKLYELDKLGLMDMDLSNVIDDDAHWEYGITPDWQGAIYLSGPVPLFKSNFFLSHYAKDTEYALLVPQNSYSDKVTSFNLSTQISKKIKTNFYYTYSSQRGVGGTNGLEVTDPISSNPYHTSLTPKHIWLPNTLVPGEHYKHYSGLKINWQMNVKSVLSIQLNHTLTECDMVMKFRDTLPYYNPDYPESRALLYGILGTEEELERKAEKYPRWQNWQRYAKIKIGDIWYDEAPWGYEPTIWIDVTGQDVMFYATRRKNQSLSRGYELKIKFKHRWASNHKLISGIDIYRDRLLEKYNKRYGGDGNIYIADVQQWRGAFYFTDKIKHSFFNGDVGIRMDWKVQDQMITLNGDESDKVNGPYSEYLIKGYAPPFYPNHLQKLQWKQKNEFHFSPRVSLYKNFNYLKIFLNYGHYYQWPKNHDVYSYRRAIGYGGRVDWLGNSDLKAIKTIKYEFGAFVNIKNWFSLNTVAYHKGISNEIGYTKYYYKEAEYDWFYTKPFNTISRKINGLECTLEKPLNRFFCGRITLDFFKHEKTVKGYKAYYEDPLLDPKVNNEVSKTDIRPILKSTINFQTPANFGFPVKDFHPLSKIHIVLDYYWQKGETIQWQGNDITWRPYQNTNIHIEKSLFTSNFISAKFYVNIYNLFNNKNMIAPMNYLYDDHGNVTGAGSSLTWNGFSWWQNEFNKYMNSLDIVGGDRPGDYPHDGKKSYIDMPGFTPWTFLEKRDVFVGLALKYSY